MPVHQAAKLESEAAIRIRALEQFLPKGID
jgi:hypothetical protein